jgi:haloalkane dehalogenase
MTDPRVAVKVGTPDRQIAVFEYLGADPAFVLMHGFPDNSHIYDQLIPQLLGHHVVTFDFLGWGASDKAMASRYTSESQEGDLTEVIAALGLASPILVGHDASGPVALNWALTHPSQTGGVALLNTYYGATPALRFPEFIQLFSDPTLAALAAAFAQSPAQLGWLLNWQGSQMRQGARDPEALEAIIQAQFRATPSVVPAFMSLTRDLWHTVQRDTERHAQVATIPVPVSIIFGSEDPYLAPMASYFHELIPASDLHLVKAGHWLQWDAPSEVARTLLVLASRAARGTP